MTTYTYGYKEKTVLSPIDTRFNIDCYILDATYINSANRNGEFQLTFQPYSNYDYAQLDERINSAMATVMMETTSYSNKVPKKRTEDKNRNPCCNQLFTSKVNIEFEHPDMLRGRQASLTLHLRDAVDGSIYLQCEYCDVYEKVAPEIVDEKPAEEDDF